MPETPTFFIYDTHVNAMKVRLAVLELGQNETPTQISKFSTNHIWSLMRKRPWTFLGTTSWLSSIELISSFFVPIMEEPNESHNQSQPEAWSNATVPYCMPSESSGDYSMSSGDPDGVDVQSARKEPDEVERVHSLTKSETKRVRLGKVAVVATILVTGLLVSAFTFVFLWKNEHRAALSAVSPMKGNLLSNSPLCSSIAFLQLLFSKPLPTVFRPCFKPFAEWAKPWLPTWKPRTRLGHFWFIRHSRWLQVTLETCLELKL